MSDVLLANGREEQRYLGHHQKKEESHVDSSYIHLAWLRHMLCDTTCCNYRSLPLGDFGQSACYTLNKICVDICTCVESHLMECRVRVWVVTNPDNPSPVIPDQGDGLLLFSNEYLCLHILLKEIALTTKILQDRDLFISLENWLSFSKVSDKKSI